MSNDVTCPDCEVGYTDKYEHTCTIEALKNRISALNVALDLMTTQTDLEALMRMFDNAKITYSESVDSFGTLLVLSNGIPDVLFSSIQFDHDGNLRHFNGHAR